MVGTPGTGDVEVKGRCYDSIPVLPERDAYEDAWKSLNRRKGLCLCVFLGLVPLLLLYRASRSDEAYVPVFGWITFGWAAALFGATAWLDSFRCPCCQEWFGRTWWRRKLFTRKCVHCGLPIGAQAPGTEA
jgi:hypothetical protein